MNLYIDQNRGKFAISDGDGWEYEYIGIKNFNGSFVSKMKINIKLFIK